MQQIQMPRLALLFAINAPVARRGLWPTPWERAHSSATPAAPVGSAATAAVAALTLRGPLHLGVRRVTRAVKALLVAQPCVDLVVRTPRPEHRVAPCAHAP